MPSQNLPLLKLLLIFLAAIIFSSFIAAAYFFGQITAKRQLAPSSLQNQEQISKQSGPILLNPVLNVSQNQKYMELLNLDNQIISLLGLPYLQINPTASFLQPYTQGLNPQESSVPTLKNLFTQRDTFIKDLGLVREEQ